MNAVGSIPGDPRGRLVRSAALGATLGLLVIIGTNGVAANDECPSGNLLAGARAHDAYDAYHTERMTDGIVALEGDPWISDRSVMLTSVGFVVYRLESVQRIRAVALQADHDDAYRISVSRDGTKWSPLWVVPISDQPGMRLRFRSGLDEPVRYLRVDAAGGDGGYAVGELAAYCREPDPWPPVLRAEPGRVRDAAWHQARERRLAWGKVTVGIVGGLLIVLLASARRRARRLSVWVEPAVLLVVIGASVAAWTNFGTFHGNGVRHAHEMFHYVMGSKYFEQNRYTNLYHCTEIAEAELGRRAFVERRAIRDLETNRLQPASAVLDNPERCRRAFTPERWEAFKNDVEFFRAADYPGSWGANFRDYGYNATPVWTLAGSTLTNIGAVSRKHAWLALIDPVLYLALFGLIFWAFGLEACALAVLWWGVGHPWGYEWTGGAFARVPWLCFAVGAVCLLKKRWFGAAGALLALSALLRLFPVAFLAGPLLLAVGGLVRERRLAPQHLRWVTGAAVAGVLVVALSVAAGDAARWREFADNSAKHRETALGNLMGLPALFAWHPDRTQAEMLEGRLEDYEAWSSTRRATFDSRRIVYWPVAAGLALLVVLFVLRPPAAPWEAAAAGTLLIGGFLELTCYYYVFLILLAPLAVERRRWGALWVLAAVASQLIALSGAAVDTRYAMESALFLTTMAWFFIDVMRTRRRGAPREAQRRAAV